MSWHNKAKIKKKNNFKFQCKLTAASSNIRVYYQKHTISKWLFLNFYKCIYTKKYAYQQLKQAKGLSIIHMQHPSLIAKYATLSFKIHILNFLHALPTAAQPTILSAFLFQKFKAMISHLKLSQE